MTMPKKLCSDHLRIHWVEFGNCKIRAAVRTAASKRAHKPPLLLLGGTGAGIDAALPVADAFPRRNVVMLDPPGIGQSKVLHRPLNMGDYATLLATLLDQLNYQQVDTFGYSWGGALAQQFALRYSSRCRRLVLAAASAGALSPPRKARVTVRYLNPLRFIKPEVLRHSAGDLYGGEQRTDPTIAIKYARAIHAGNYVGYYLQLAAVLHWSSRPWLHRISQPTLILAGSDDPLTPLSVAELLHKRIPGSRLEVIDDGHLFLLSQTEKVCQLVEAFLCEAGIEERKGRGGCASVVVEMRRDKGPLRRHV